MRMFLPTTAFLFAAAVAMPMRAGDFTPLPVAGDTVLDLDVQTGSYSGWILKDIRGVNAVRATLMVHRLGDDPKWAPAFRMAVKSGDRAVALQILGKAGLPELVVLLARAGAGPDEQLEDFSRRIAVDEKLDVAIDWTADGKVTVRAGGESKTAELGGAPTGLEFTASTGEVEFNPLKIGAAAP